MIKVLFITILDGAVMGLSIITLFFGLLIIAEERNIAILGTCILMVYMFIMVLPFLLLANFIFSKYPNLWIFRSLAMLFYMGWLYFTIHDHYISGISRAKMFYNVHLFFNIMLFLLEELVIRKFIKHIY